MPHALLAPLLGSAWASTLFGIALFCYGFNSMWLGAASIAPIGQLSH